MRCNATVGELSTPRAALPDGGQCCEKDVSRVALSKVRRQADLLTVAAAVVETV